MAPAIVPLLNVILPMFLLGMMAAPMRADLGLTTTQLGMALATFTMVAAVTSTPLGWLGERLGSGRAIRLAVLLSGSAAALVATSSGFARLAVGMAVGGLGQALIEPSVNIYLLRAVDPAHLGLAFGIKQAATPAATLLGGLAVPAVAIPFGWRWVYGAVCVLTAISLVVAPRGTLHGGRRRSEGGRIRVRLLLVVAVGMGFATAAASTVSGFIVDAAAEAGVTEGRAGALAALGGALGIAARILLGARADRRVGEELRVAAQMLLVGVVVFVLLATGLAPAYVVAVPLAFVSAWGWFGLLSLAVVRLSPQAPGTASGISNIGAFLGGVVGPIAFGAAVDATSYTTAWLLPVGWSIVGGAVFLGVDRYVRRHPSPAAADVRSG